MNDEERKPFKNIVKMIIDDYNSTEIKNFPSCQIKNTGNNKVIPLIIETRDLSNLKYDLKDDCFKAKSNETTISLFWMGAEGCSDKYPHLTLKEILESINPHTYQVLRIYSAIDTTRFVDVESSPFIYDSGVTVEKHKREEDWRPTQE